MFMDSDVICVASISRVQGTLELAGAEESRAVHHDVIRLWLVGVDGGRVARVAKWRHSSHEFPDWYKSRSFRRCKSKAVGIEDYFPRCSRCRGFCRLGRSLVRLRPGALPPQFDAFLILDHQQAHPPHYSYTPRREVLAAKCASPAFCSGPTPARPVHACPYLPVSLTLLHTTPPLPMPFPRHPPDLDAERARVKKLAR